MGLSWINPLFLFGLSLLALPVLIHLVQKQVENGVRFPSLMFLQRIPRREKRRLVIRNWPLLLLRCLLLLLIVLAFARPLLDGERSAGALDPGRSDSIILLDRSYSMRVADYWQQARDKALELVDEKGAQDRIGVILFDEEVEVLADLSEDATKLRSMLQGPAPGYRVTRYAAAVEQAARLLGGSNASRKRILLISDFQVAATPAVPRIASDIEIELLPVTTARSANATLTAVEIEPSSRAAADEIALSVKVTNRSDAPLQQSLSLRLDGRELARRDLQLAPNAVVSEHFDRLGVSDDLLRGVVSLGDDALALDNHYFFVYSSRQRLPLLIVEGSAPRANQSVFLQSALRLSRNPVFRVERTSLDELLIDELASHAVIILNDSAIPAGELGEALADFVEAGGALLIASAEAAPGNWASGANGFLPGSPGQIVDAGPGRAYNITEFETDHPLTAAMGRRNATDLSLGRVFSYRAFEAGARDRVVARYNDGGVALLERRIGQGRVMVLTTTLDTHWNDLALQPVFLPLLYQALRYLTAWEPYSQQASIGDIADAMRHARALAGAEAVVAAAADAPLIVESPSAGAIRLDRQSPLLPLSEPGFYQVHRATPTDVEVTLAANIDPDEASQEKLDLDRFVEEIKASAEAPLAATALTRRQAAEYEQQQQLWYAILLTALLLALVEALYANWTGGRRLPGKRAESA